MADEKKQDKEIKVILEREYVIPLREKCRPVPRYKKTPKAVRTIKQFIIRHMKIYDNDSNKVKIDKYLNEFLWNYGIKKPVHKVKVKASKLDNGDVKVELFEFPKFLQQKKSREDKLHKLAEKAAEKKKKEKPVEESKEVNEPLEKEIEKTIEDKEKKVSTVEAGKAMEKEMAKSKKHETKIDKKPAKTKAEHSKGQQKR